LFDDALRQLLPTQPRARQATAQLRRPATAFSTATATSVPRALFLDRRLTPLERNAWQVFRLQLNDDGVTAFPTYDQLRPYLASMPCAAQASHETVARALTLLRLTRWLSLVRRRRDPKTGRILGNLYVLHDEPLTPFEAMQLDPDYLGLVSQALTHAAKAVQIVGMNTLRRSPKTRCSTAARCPRGCRCWHSAWRHGWATRVIHRRLWITNPKKARTASSESRRPSSESEAGPKPRQTAHFGIRRRTVLYVWIV
jgi:hypothetical protein